MKINVLHGYKECGKTTVDITVESELSVSEALSSVLALFAGERGIGGTGAGSPNWSDAEVASMRKMRDAAREVPSAEQAAQIRAEVKEYVDATGGPHGETQAQAFATVMKEDAGVRVALAAYDVAAPAAEEPKAEKVTRTRRPRTNPDASATETTAAAPVEDVSPSVGAPSEAGARRRTRVTAEPPAPEVKTITDADLAKAASSGAAQVGTEIISIILGELEVTTVSEIPTDRREWFLQQIDNEITAAKEELAKAGK